MNIRKVRMFVFFFRELQEKRGIKERKGQQEDLGLEDLRDLLDQLLQ